MTLAIALRSAAPNPGRLPEHVHNTDDGRGACSVCYQWSLLALRYSAEHPEINTYVPREPSDHWSKRKKGGADGSAKPRPEDTSSCPQGDRGASGGCLPAGDARAVPERQSNARPPCGNREAAEPQLAIKLLPDPQSGRPSTDLKNMPTTGQAGASGIAPK